MFYFTTCGWMIVELARERAGRGASLRLFDGSPFVSRGRVSGSSPRPSA